jgi:hypothetical protein
LLGGARLRAPTPPDTRPHRTSQLPQECRASFDSINTPCLDTVAAPPLADRAVHRVAGSSESSQFPRSRTLRLRGFRTHRTHLTLIAHAARADDRAAGVREHCSGLGRCGPAASLDACFASSAVVAEDPVTRTRSFPSDGPSVEPADSAWQARPVLRWTDNVTGVGSD